MKDKLINSLSDEVSMNVRVGNGEVLLGGGGDADDSSPVDKRLVEQIGDDATMGYIPVAMPSKRYPDCMEWITSVFERYGLTNIEMWPDLTEVTTETVADVSAIYIGGGNTYRLLNKVRTTGLDTLLYEFVSDGGALYGGSAGAIICGETIETTPDENRAGIVDTTGLGLFPTTDIWCHYEPNDAVPQYVTDTGRTVIAIPERSGVSVTETRYKIVGHEPIRVFQNGNKTMYSPGEHFRLSETTDTTS